MDEPVIDMGYLSLPGEVQEALEYPEGVRQRIDAALQDSVDNCARCKACDRQVDAVMNVLAAETHWLSAGTAAVPLDSLRAILRFVRPAGDCDAMPGEVRAAYDRLAAAAGRF